jgi:DnaK suppressor protein
MSKYGAVATTLKERLGKLVGRVRRIEGDLRSTHDRDWAEQAIELENDEVLQGLDEMTILEVRQIRGALRRIETGHYGVCSSCGQPIAAARLAAIPTAVTCMGCAPQ